MRGGGRGRGRERGQSRGHGPHPPSAGRYAEQHNNQPQPAWDFPPEAAYAYAEHPQYSELPVEYDPEKQHRYHGSGRQHSTEHWPSGRLPPQFNNGLPWQGGTVPAHVPGPGFASQAEFVHQMPPAHHVPGPRPPPGSPKGAAPTIQQPSTLPSRPPHTIPVPPPPQPPAYLQQPVPPQHPYQLPHAPLQPSVLAYAPPPPVQVQHPPVQAFPAPSAPFAAQAPAAWPRPQAPLQASVPPPQSGVSGHLGKQTGPAVLTVLPEAGPSGVSATTGPLAQQPVVAAGWNHSGASHYPATAGTNGAASVASLPQTAQATNQPFITTHTPTVPGGVQQFGEDNVQEAHTTTTTPTVAAPALTAGETSKPASTPFPLDSVAPAKPKPKSSIKANPTVLKQPKIAIAKAPQPSGSTPPPPAVSPIPAENASAPTADDTSAVAAQPIAGSSAAKSSSVPGTTDKAAPHAASPAPGSHASHEPLPQPTTTTGALGTSTAETSGAPATAGVAGWLEFAKRQALQAAGREYTPPPDEKSADHKRKPRRWGPDLPATAGTASGKDAAAAATYPSPKPAQSLDKPTDRDRRGRSPTRRARRRTSRSQSSSSSSSSSRSGSDTTRSNSRERSRRRRRSREPTKTSRKSTPPKSDKRLGDQQIGNQAKRVPQPDIDKRSTAQAQPVKAIDNPSSLQPTPLPAATGASHRPAPPPGAPLPPRSDTSLKLPDGKAPAQTGLASSRPATADTAPARQQPPSQPVAVADSARSPTPSPPRGAHIHARERIHDHVRQPVPHPPDHGPASRRDDRYSQAGRHRDSWDVPDRHGMDRDLLDRHPDERYRHRDGWADQDRYVKGERERERYHDEDFGSYHPGQGGRFDDWRGHDRRDIAAGRGYGHGPRDLHDRHLYDRRDADRYGRNVHFPERHPSHQRDARHPYPRSPSPSRRSPLSPDEEMNPRWQGRGFAPPLRHGRGGYRSREASPMRRRVSPTRARPTVRYSPASPDASPGFAIQRRSPASRSPRHRGPSFTGSAAQLDVAQQRTQHAAPQSAGIRPANMAERQAHQQPMHAHQPPEASLAPEEGQHAAVKLPAEEIQRLRQLREVQKTQRRSDSFEGVSPQQSPLALLASPLADQAHMDDHDMDVASEESGEVDVPPPPPPPDGNDFTQHAGYEADYGDATLPPWRRNERALTQAVAHFPAAAPVVPPKADMHPQHTGAPGAHPGTPPQELAAVPPPPPPPPPLTPEEEAKLLQPLFAQMSRLSELYGYGSDFRAQLQPLLAAMTDAVNTEFDGGIPADPQDVVPFAVIIKNDEEDEGRSWDQPVPLTTEERSIMLDTDRPPPDLRPMAAAYKQQGGASPRHPQPLPIIHDQWEQPPTFQAYVDGLQELEEGEARLTPPPPPASFYGMVQEGWSTTPPPAAPQAAAAAEQKPAEAAAAQAAVASAAPSTQLSAPAAAAAPGPLGPEDGDWKCISLQRLGSIMPRFRPETRTMAEWRHQARMGRVPWGISLVRQSDNLYLPLRDEPFSADELRWGGAQQVPPQRAPQADLQALDLEPKQELNYEQLAEGLKKAGTQVRYFPHRAHIVKLPGLAAAASAAVNAAGTEADAISAPDANRASAADAASAPAATAHADTNETAAASAPPPSVTAQGVAPVRSAAAADGPANVPRAVSLAVTSEDKPPLVVDLLPSFRGGLQSARAHATHLCSSATGLWGPPPPPQCGAELRAHLIFTMRSRGQQLEAVAQQVLAAALCKRLEQRQAESAAAAAHAVHAERVAAATSLPAGADSSAAGPASLPAATGPGQTAAQPLLQNARSLPASGSLQRAASAKIPARPPAATLMPQGVKRKAPEPPAPIRGSTHQATKGAAQPPAGGASLKRPATSPIKGRASQPLPAPAAPSAAKRPTSAPPHKPPSRAEAAGNLPTVPPVVAGRPAAASAVSPTVKKKRGVLVSSSDEEGPAEQRPSKTPRMEAGSRPAAQPSVAAPPVIAKQELQGIEDRKATAKGVKPASKHRDVQAAAAAQQDSHGKTVQPHSDAALQQSTQPTPQVTTDLQADALPAVKAADEAPVKQEQQLKGPTTDSAAKPVTKAAPSQFTIGTARSRGKAAAPPPPPSPPVPSAAVAQELPAAPAATRKRTPEVSAVNPKTKKKRAITDALQQQPSLDLQGADAAAGLPLTGHRIPASVPADNKHASDSGTTKPDEQDTENQPSPKRKRPSAEATQVAAEDMGHATDSAAMHPKPAKPASAKQKAGSVSMPADKPSPAACRAAVHKQLETALDELWHLAELIKEESEEEGVDFIEPVSDKEIPDYKKKLKECVCLQDMRIKLRKGEYDDGWDGVHTFFYDAHLIAINSRRWNITPDFFATDVADASVRWVDKLNDLQQKVSRALMPDLPAAKTAWAEKQRHLMADSH